MPQVCTVCSHAERHAIDVALVSGTPNRRVASQHGVTEASVRRHRQAHLPAAMARAATAAELADADDLAAQVRGLQARTLAILDAADAAGDRRTALAAIHRAQDGVKLVAQLTGALRERVEVDVEQREFVAVWSTPDGTLGPAAHHQSHVAEAVPALPLVQGDGTNCKPSSS